MLKKLFLAVLLACIGQPLLAQAVPLVDTNNPPPPLANEFGPLAEVPDGLNINNLLFDVPIAPSGAPDDVGAFRLTCAPGQVLTDDPLVYPGQPGRSHLHQFFGNLGANAHSTYASLRTTGESTCNNKLWRSAYWMPGMLNGPGPDAKVVRPDFASVYYKRWPQNSPRCTPGHPTFVGRCVGLPNGIRFIAGVDMVTGLTPNGSLAAKCVIYTPTAIYSGPDKPDIVQAAATCPTVPSSNTGPQTSKLSMVINAPECWDGQNLDSPNHRSHTHNHVYDPAVGMGRCPASHPYAIPGYTLITSYTTDATLDRSGTWEVGRKTWYLASDVMPGMPHRKPGTTFHFDLFDAGAEAVKKMWTDHCIDKLLNCSAGDLGNGKQLTQDIPHPEIATPRIVNRPKMVNEPVEFVVRGVNSLLDTSAANKLDSPKRYTYAGVALLVLAVLLLAVAIYVVRRRRRKGLKQ